MMFYKLTGFYTNGQTFETLIRADDYTPDNVDRIVFHSTSDGAAVDRESVVVSGPFEMEV